MAYTALILGNTAGTREGVADCLDNTGLVHRKLYCKDARRAIRWLSEYDVDIVCCDWCWDAHEEISDLMGVLRRRVEWHDLPVLLFTLRGRSRTLVDRHGDGGKRMFVLGIADGRTPRQDSLALEKIANASRLCIRPRANWRVLPFPMVSQDYSIAPISMQPSVRSWHVAPVADCP